MSDIGEYNQDFHIHEDEPVFTSGVVCRLLSIPVWVLKQLDREKIVSPSRKGRKSRLYSKRELNKLRYVWYLMEKRDVKVGGLKVIIEMQNNTFKIE